MSFFLDDHSVRLVEWLELLRALGFSKVFLHTQDVHPRVDAVLREYEKEGFVTFTQYDTPKPYPDEPTIRRDNLPQCLLREHCHSPTLLMWSRIEKMKEFILSSLYTSDCLMRHMHEYRYIAHLDPDEMPILPRHDSYLTWLEYILEQGLKEATERKSSLPASYVMKRCQHPSDLPPAEAAADLPEHLWMLRHTKVFQDPYEDDFVNVKSLFDTDTAMVAMPHNLTLCASGKCPFRRFEVPEEDGYIAHFTGSCGDHCTNSGNIEETIFLTQHKTKVHEAVNNVLKNLNLL
ncbi:hypothetical protein SK128_011403 [Halocaridina rubra]|uniref:Glycosyltransferase family 92 protein n=1 Tax=Halocaridina rubra TaxID=373956 RepID=A0AAN8ZSD0_HALRR